MEIIGDNFVKLPNWTSLSSFYSNMFFSHEDAIINVEIQDLLSRALYKVTFGTQKWT